MVGVIGVLGKLPFICSEGMVLTFNGLSRDLSTRWAQHDVIGAKPVLEWIGDDLASVNLSIRFDMSLGAPPLAGLLALKLMMESREAHLLVIGGEYFGRFVIESISEDRKFHSGAGVCIVAEASITLKEMPTESLINQVKGAF